MTSVEIAFTIIGSLILAAGIFCFFYFVVFSNIRIKRQAKESVAVFETSHAILFGEITQYIKRLETISSMNLSYAQDYSDWLRKFKDIRDVSDISAANAADEIQDLLEQRKFRTLKAELPQYRSELEDFQKRVEALSRSLKIKFVEEEETKQVMLSLGDRYRSLKQNYYARQSDLAIMTSSFEIVFEKIDDLFTQANEFIENANYNSSKQILNSKIDPLITELSLLVVNLPAMCVSIQKVLPDKLSSVKYRYEVLSSQGYPLNHIVAPETFNSIERKIKEMSNHLKNFEVAGIQKDINSLLPLFDEYNKLFTAEEEAKTIFDSEHDKIYSDENGMESRFINLCHALPGIKKIYLLTVEDQNLIDQIQQKINISGATKRSLDTYQHSLCKQPYSILVDKMHELRNHSNEATSQIDNFQKYLVTMKHDTEEAANNLPYYASKVSEAEAALRNIGIPNLTARYKETIDSIYQMIDDLYEIISKAPIDVRKVNQTHQILKDTADSLFSLLENEKIQLEKTEEAIVYANRFRNAASNDSLLRQAEALFIGGEFENAVDMISHVKDPKEEGYSNQ